MAQCVHHQALFARLHLHEVFAAVERDLADARLALHAFADHRERLTRDRAVRREIVGALEVNRIDRRVVGELLEVDHARRVDADLLDVFVAHDDVAPFFELEALDDVGVGHFTLALRTPALLLDPCLTLAVQLVEAQGRAGIGRWKHLDRDVHEADLEITLPRRSRRHVGSPGAERAQLLLLQWSKTAVGRDGLDS